MVAYSSANVVRELTLDVSPWQLYAEVNAATHAKRICAYPVNLFVQINSESTSAISKYQLRRFSRVPLCKHWLNTDIICNVPAR